MLHQVGMGTNLLFNMGHPQISYLAILLSLWPLVKGF
jgi:hypothetical protein